ncbi:MAG: hypothetical protein AAFP07_03380 [Cyanobacteria bacterium J06606_4]
MNRILQDIDVRQAQFSNLAFFKFLEQGNQIEDSKIFIAGIAFFVLAFQDMLRINEAKITDPELLPIAQHHRQEDLGHDAWFLHDLKQLDANCDAALLFGHTYAKTRDASYEIVSEIYKASDDRVRLVIPLTLEATGHVFFSRAYHFFARAGYQKKLKYFSEEHFRVELNHEIFDKEINERLEAIHLTDELREEALAVVDRIFRALTMMVSDIYDHIEASQEKTSQSVEGRAIASIS